MKILICEDEEILLTALEFRMRKAGFDVVLAKNGKSAIEKIHQEHFDLVIADIEMPVMDGLELIQHIDRFTTDSPPVIVISALEHEEEIMQALSLGAKDFVAKPFKPAELVLRAKCIFEAAKRAETVDESNPS
ncbi:MAG: response regulator transcription factor [Bacteroidota bacterium]